MYRSMSGMAALHEIPIRSSIFDTNRKVLSTLIPADLCLVWLQQAVDLKNFDDGT